MGRSSTFSLIRENAALIAKYPPSLGAARPRPLHVLSSFGLLMFSLGPPSDQPSSQAGLTDIGHRPTWEQVSYINTLRHVDCWPVPDLVTLLLDNFFDHINSVRPRPLWHTLVGHPLNRCPTHSGSTSALRELVQTVRFASLRKESTITDDCPPSRVDEKDFLLDGDFARLCLLVSTSLQPLPTSPELI